MTLKELMWMSDAKQFHDWKIASQLSFLIAEPNRNAKEIPEPFTEQTFNPFELNMTTEEESVAVCEDLTLLGKMFAGA